MDSASKVKISKSELDKLISEALGSESKEVKEVPGGWFNTIYHFTMQDQAQYAIKFSPPPNLSVMTYEKHLLQAEQEVSKFLHSKNFLVPDIKGEGKSTITLESGEQQSLSWFIYSFLDGENLNDYRENSRNNQKDVIADFETARQLAKINSITGDSFGRWVADEASSQDWYTSFSQMCLDLMDDAQFIGIALPISHDDMKSILINGKKSLEQVKSPRLVIWDLHDGNIIVKKADGSLSGFIDPDRALWGDPLLEYYFRSMSKTSAKWYKDYFKHFLQTEPPIDLESSEAKKRIALYDLYLTLIMVIEVGFRSFTGDHETWARNLLAETLEFCKEQKLL